MTITARAQVAASVIRAVMLGATDDEAIATVAQALHLSIEAVAECLKAEEAEA
jgi:Arc/MetJ family transcription regulator